MARLRFTFRLVTVLACFVFGNLMSHAQQRTWVSGTGDDANPCSRDAPCRTFAGAITKTAQNGEIDALDPHGYGAFTVTKSITVEGTGTLAGVLASSTTGIIINLDPALGNTDAVHTIRLRGLALNGSANNSKTGIRGINVASTNFTDLKVFIEDLVIDGFVNEGILYSVNGGDLIVKNTTIRNNNKAGIRVDSSGANLAYVSLNRVSTDLNQEGVRFEDGVRGTILNSTALNNSLNGYVVFPSTLSSEMNVDNSTSANNRQYGAISITSGAATGTIRISNMEITNNVVGGLAAFGGGQICSNGKNRITAPTIAPTCAFTEQ